VPRVLPYVVLAVLALAYPVLPRLARTFDRPKGMWHELVGYQSEVEGRYVYVWRFDNGWFLAGRVEHRRNLHEPMDRLACRRVSPALWAEMTAPVARHWHHEIWPPWDDPEILSLTFKD
jgi:hypothetical protein